MSRAIVGPTRPRFLILALACVVLGVATAYSSGATLNVWHIALIAIGALAAHASVNALNEYDDFRSGLDLITEATPFSGGTKTLPTYPAKAHLALITGLLCLALTVGVGIYFAVVSGPGILPIGVLGLILVYTYTKWITRRPLLCLIAPGLGFGPLMVMGTDFALSRAYSWTAFVASLVPFFLVSDLLLLNQFPDVEADKTIGRDHLPIRIGRKASARVYNLMLMLTYVAIVVGWMLGVLPAGGLLGLLTLALAVPVMRGVTRYADDIPRLVPFLGWNVLINITTPILIAVGLFLRGRPG